MLAFYQSTIYQAAGIVTPPQDPVQYSSVSGLYCNPLPTSYGPPQTITAGGIYTFNAESTDVNVPAVYINTSEAVILLNCNIKANGWGIDALMSNRSKTLNLQVLNCRHNGGAASAKKRMFIEASAVKNLRIEHCYMEQSAGIKLAGAYVGNSTESETVKVRFNKAKNMDSRTATGSIHSSFFQCDGLMTTTVYQTDNPGEANEVLHYEGIPYMEVGWNDIENLPGLSHVEDNINIYNSRGATWSPMRIHHNSIKGANFADWQADTGFSGSGMITDSPGANPGNCAAFVNFEDNLVIMSSNNDYGVAGGHDIKFLRNVGLCKGYLDEADAIRLGVTPASAACELKQYPGNIYVHDDQPGYTPGTTYNVLEQDHIEGIHGERTFSAGNPRWRNDGDFWDTAKYGQIINRTTIAGEITEATEQYYRSLWEQARDAASVTIGVTNSIRYSNNMDSANSLTDGAFTQETSTAYGITRSTTQKYSGTHSMRVELRNTDAATFGGVRAEIAFSPLPEDTTAMWFKFRAYIPSAEYATDTEPESIMQFRPVADTDLGETDNRPPTIALQIINGVLRLKILYSTDAVNTTATETDYSCGAVTYDAWVEYIVYYKLAQDATGNVQFWKNGTKLLHHDGPNTMNDVSKPYWKLGVYKWNWPATSNTVKRVVYYDDIKIGGPCATLSEMQA